MKESEFAFSLLDEPWIVCLTADGKTAELSLLEVLRRATEIREIVGDLPTQGFAMLRLLLAITSRAVGGPEDEREWEELWSSGVPRLRAIEAYLEQHRSRFDLFGSRPFLQTAGLRTASGDVAGLEKLIGDVPSGHPYFTTRIGAGVTSLTPAEAVRWLVHLQAFDVSGIKSGAVGDPRVKKGKGYPIGTGWAGTLGGLYVEGDNLWQTLLLNLVPIDQPDLCERVVEDRPTWEAEPPGPGPSSDAERRPYGPLDLFTWQSRRVLLHGSPDGITGVTVANGDKLTPQNMHRREPMSAWRRSVPQQKKLGLPLVYMPQEHDPTKSVWRGLATILPAVSPRGKGDGADHLTAGVVEWAGRALDGRRPIVLRAIGASYGTHSSVIDDVFDDRLAIHAALIGSETHVLQYMVVEAVGATERAVLALRNLASNVVKAAGGTDPRLADGARDRAAEKVYAALERPFRLWLSALLPDAEPEAARDRWHRQARSIVRDHGERILAATGPEAWVGREVSGRRLSSPEADNWFRAAVATALPVAQERQEAS